MIRFTNYEAEKYTKEWYRKLASTKGEPVANLFLSKLKDRFMKKQLSEVELLDFNINKTDIKSILKTI